MSDLISRQAAIARIDKMDIPEDMCVFEILSHVELELGTMPTANQWIPCSERLPNDDELMLVTYVDPRPEAMDIWIGWHEMENVWYIDGEAHSNEFGNEVIAWMPLPKPWKGEQNDKNENS